MAQLLELEEDQIIRAMKELGFTVSDARVYLALLGTHPATGYELAASSGVPRSAIYNVLRRLDKLGLVNSINEKPARYVPLSPQNLVQLIESRFSRTVEDLKSSLESLSARAPEVATWTSRGYTAMLDRARDLITGAEKTVFAALWKREAEQLTTPFRQALAAGVEVVIFSFNRLPDDIGETLCYGIAEDKLEKYWRHKVIIISDQQRALIGGADQSNDNRSVVTEESSLVEMAISNLVLDITLFGQRTERDLSKIITGLTSHLAPIEDLVSEALDNS